VKAVLVKQLFLESGFIVEISVIDNGIGQGVTFTLKLPLRVGGQSIYHAVESAACAPFDRARSLSSRSVNHSVCEPLDCHLWRLR
jgi:hypothetical protein